MVGISEGAAVDKISIDKQFSDAEYAYLIIDGRVYDFLVMKIISLKQIYCMTF